MKNLSFFICALLLGGLGCTEKLDELAYPDVATVSIETGSLTDLTGSVATISSMVKSVGDGVVEYGHVWSADNNNPVITNSKSGNTGDIVSSLSFTDTLDLGSSSKYFLRSYAIDVHECVHYGEVVVVNIITPGELPVACFSFECSPSDCTSPNSVSLTDCSSNVETWEWYIDDQLYNNSSIPPPISFDQPGSYIVKLVVANQEGEHEFIDTVNIEALTFDTTFNGLGPAKQVVVMPNGNYAIVGNNGTVNNSRIYLVILDREGKDIKTIESPLNISNNDAAEDMALFTTNELVIVGSTANPYVPGKDFLYMKTDLEGNPTFGPRRDSISEGNDVAYGVIQTAGGTSTIVGSVTSASGDLDIYLKRVKDDFSQGFFSRAIETGNANSEIGYDVYTDPNAGNDFFLVGKSTFGGVDEAIFVRTNSSGVEEEIKYHSYSGNNVTIAFAIAKSPFANEFFFCGNTAQSLFSDRDMYFNKVDLDGEEVGSFPIKFGESNTEESGAEIIVLSDNSIVLAGTYNEDGFLAKFDQNGNEIWDSPRLIGDASSNEKFVAVKETPDGGLIVVGAKNNNLFVVKLNHLGEF